MPVNDKFGYHELLHTAHIMACVWEDHIEGHAVLESEPELKAEAERIGRAIADYYQKVARASDAAFPDDLTKPGYAGSDICPKCEKREEFRLLSHTHYDGWCFRVFRHECGHHSLLSQYDHHCSDKI